MVANPIRTNDGVKRFLALGLTPRYTVIRPHDPADFFRPSFVAPESSYFDTTPVFDSRLHTRSGATRQSRRTCDCRRKRNRPASGDLNRRAQSLG